MTAQKKGGTWACLLKWSCSLFHHLLQSGQFLYLFQDLESLRRQEESLFGLVSVWQFIDGHFVDDTVLFTSTAMSSVVTASKSS